MSDRLPPLTALRAFEAAARHMSFARAADELNVTAAALSFQIKALETDLGVPVFHRLNRAVELTEAGRALVPGTHDGFAALHAAWSAARRLAGGRGLTVTAGPGFTAKWLAPRLFHFAGQHPEIELKFSATLRLMDFGRDDIDVAIRFSASRFEGLYDLPLLRDWVAPMMTREMAARIRRPEDLAGAVLLRHDEPAVAAHVGWPAWFRAAGLEPPPMTGPRFSQVDHAIDAALAGAGVVLGRWSLSHAARLAGQLVMPFPLALDTGVDYRFLCEAGAEQRPQVAAFRDWIVAEIEAMKASTEIPVIVQAAA